MPEQPNFEGSQSTPIDYAEVARNYLDETLFGAWKERAKSGLPENVATLQELCRMYSDDNKKLYAVLEQIGNTIKSGATGEELLSEIIDIYSDWRNTLSTT
jgi:hypothetical protein